MPTMPPARSPSASTSIETPARPGRSPPRPAPGTPAGRRSGRSRCGRTASPGRRRTRPRPAGRPAPLARCSRHRRSPAAPSPPRAPRAAAAPPPAAAAGPVGRPAGQHRPRHGAHPAGGEDQPDRGRAEPELAGLAHVDGEEAGSEERDRHGHDGDGPAAAGPRSIRIPPRRLRLVLGGHDVVAPTCRPRTARPGERPDDWWANTGYAQARREHDERTGGAPADDVALFLHDVPPDLAAEALRRARSPSATPGAQPWPLPAWPDVPTRFLLCRDDRFVPAGFLRRVLQDRLAITPDEIDGSHRVALCRPRDLADTWSRSGPGCSNGAGPCVQRRAARSVSCTRWWCRRTRRRSTTRPGASAPRRSSSRGHRRRPCPG